MAVLSARAADRARPDADRKTFPTGRKIRVSYRCNISNHEKSIDAWVIRYI